MKIWKMADFFCSDILRDLVIKAAKNCSREMALVFCAFGPPPGHDQEKASVFCKDFLPAVKAIYEDETESLRHDFLPILLGLTVVSIHSFSQMLRFEQLLQEIPRFSADWATALMKGMPLPEWKPGWGNTNGKCFNCGETAIGYGVVDTIIFMRHSSLVVVCARCYEGPDLEDWKNNTVW